MPDVELQQLSTPEQVSNVTETYEPVAGERYIHTTPEDETEGTFHTGASQFTLPGRVSTNGETEGWLAQARPEETGEESNAIQE